MDPRQRGGSGEAGRLSREAGDRRTSGNGQTVSLGVSGAASLTPGQGLALRKRGCYSAAALSLTAQPGAWRGPQTCGPRA